MCTCDAEACQIWSQREAAQPQDGKGNNVCAVSVREGLSAAAAAVFYIIDPYAGGIAFQFKDDCRG